MKMLEGVRVLDFTTNAAGPIVGSYFADYGAEVIKVEVPGGEAGRRFAYVANGISTYACGKDRGKKSIEIKLSDPAAQKLILEQVKNFDIVLVSNKPGFMEKFGLGYEEMRKVNPGIGENSYEILESWGKSKEEAKALLEQWGAKNV